MKEQVQSIKWLIPPRFDEAGNQISSGIAVDGREYPDSVPLAPPIGYEAPVQLEHLIEQVVRRRDFEKAAEAAGVETFEQSDDFEVEEDYDPRFEETIYEAYFEAKSRRAAAKAAQAEASRTASADLAFASSTATKVEKPIVSRGSDISDQRERQPDTSGRVSGLSGDQTGSQLEQSSRKGT